MFNENEVNCRDILIDPPKLIQSAAMIWKGILMNIK